MSWQQRLAEVNRPWHGSNLAVVAHLHPDDVAAAFGHSLLGLQMFDSANQRHMVHQNPDGTARLGFIAVPSGGGRLAMGRNLAVAKFLEDYDQAEWLLFIDSDMAFEPDSLAQLVANADPVERPVVGGLCFARIYQGHGRGHAPTFTWQPTAYYRQPDGWMSTAAFQYPPDSVMPCDETGAAFVLVHRTVFEKIQAEHGPVWFDNIEGEHPGQFAGEDISFCRRVTDAGFPIHVHTGVKVGHSKTVVFGEADYRLLRRPSSSAVTVVIPVKDNLAMTRDLCGQLLAYGGYSEILIFDNGSTDPEMVAWLAEQRMATVFDATGAGIHDMWNAGIEEALGRHRGLADVVFLNNDLRVDPQFLQHLVLGLRSEPLLMAVGGNYDARRGSGVLPLRGICAGRMDGTGGLAGFAFALRAEWIASGYRFPTDMKWWYGDNDLCLSIEKAGGWYGCAVDAGCDHLDGGSKTERPSDWDAVVAADRAAFEAKWPHVTLTAA